MKLQSWITDRPHRSSTARWYLLALVLFVLCFCGDRMKAQVYNPRHLNKTKIMQAIRQPYSDLTLLIAHRGLHALVDGSTPGVPENSLESIRQAAMAGFEAIEVDVKLTQDGIPILSHDYTWGRETCIMYTPFHTSNAPFDPFTPKGNADNDYKNPKVSDVTADRMKWWFTDNTTQRDSVGLENKTNGGCSTDGIGWTGSFAPTLAEVLGFMRDHSIAMILTLDIKDAETAKKAWDLVEGTPDQTGASFANFTLFKVPARNFITTAAYDDAFGGHAFEPLLFPYYGTADIQPTNSKGSNFGSESAMMNALSQMEINRPGWIVATEVDLKEDGGILSNLYTFARTNQNNFASMRVGNFSPYKDLDKPGDIQPALPKFFKNTGYCCDTLLDYRYNVPDKTRVDSDDPEAQVLPYDPSRPSDVEDRRGDHSWIVGKGFDIVTADDVKAWDAELGSSKRNVCGRLAADGFENDCRAFIAVDVPPLTSNPRTPPEGSSAVPLRLLPTGDSITWGYSDPTGDGYRASLLAQLTSQDVAADFVGTQRNGQFADPDNEGHSGWRIDQISGIIDGVMANWQPNVVTLMIGTNDCNQNFNTSSAPGRLTSLVSQIFADDPNTAIALATLIPSATASWESCIQQMNSQIPGIVSQFQSQGKHIVLADMGAVTVGELVDGVHPNASGYQKIANGFLAAVDQLIANGWVQAAPPCSDLPTACINNGTVGSPQPRQGTGGWTPVGSVASGSPVAGEYRYADMDGDGRADFVVINPTSGALTVYLNRGTDYPTFGGWGPPIAFAAGAAPAAQVVLADVTGDRKADYLIVDPGTGAITAWQNNGGDNGGQPWTNLGQVASGAAPGILLSFADVNGDGKADYLIVDETTGAVTAWLNNGMDVPGGGGWTNLGQVARGGGPRTMVRFADLNGDGFADYLVVNPVTGAITAYLNNGMDIPGGNGWTPLGQIAAGTGAGSLVQFADIDGDKAADYLVVARKNGQTNGWLNKGGDGTALAPTLPVAIGPRQQTQGNGWLPNSLGSVASGSPISGVYRYADMDGDGKADFVVINTTSGALTVYLNKGTDYPTFGGWGPPIAFAAGSAPAAQVMLADVTGDGKADYLVIDPNTNAITAWQNNGGDNGGNGWGYLGQVGRGAAPVGNVLFADVNGDGVADYLTVDSNTGALTAWVNAGMDLPGGSGWTPLQQVAGGAGPGSQVHLADINGDGYADYILLNPGTGDVSSWLNNGMDVPGGGGWTPLNQTLLNTAGAWLGQFADLYGKGFADYLVVQSDTGQTNAWHNNGSGLSQ